MKRKVKLNKTIFDTITFSVIVVLTASLLLGLKIALSTNEALFVYVYVENTLIDRLALDIDITKTYLKSDYPPFQGDIVLEILNSKVRVEKEESPLNLCSIKGFTDTTGNPVVCLPNSFYFVIMGASYATL